MSTSARSVQCTKSFLSLQYCLCASQEEAEQLRRTLENERKERAEGAGGRSRELQEARRKLEEARREREALKRCVYVGQRMVGWKRPSFKVHFGTQFSRVSRLSVGHVMPSGLVRAVSTQKGAALAATQGPQPKARSPFTSNDARFLSLRRCCCRALAQRREAEKRLEQRLSTMLKTIEEERQTLQRRMSDLEAALRQEAAEERARLEAAHAEAVAGMRGDHAAAVQHATALAQQVGQRTMRSSVAGSDRRCARGKQQHAVTLPRLWSWSWS